MRKRKLVKWFLVGAGINALLNAFLIILIWIYENLPDTSGHPLCNALAFILSSLYLGFLAWFIFDKDPL